MTAPRPRAAPADAPPAAAGLPRDARLMLASLFLSALPIGVLIVFFPLYLRDLGLRPALIGGVFTAAGAGSALLLLAVGPLADRFGRRPFLLAGLALPAFGFAVLAATADTRWLVAASMVAGVGFSGGLGSALVQATFDPTLAATVDARRRTAALAWSEVVLSLSVALGALLAAVPGLAIAAHLAPARAVDRAVFLLSALAVAAGTLLMVPVREGTGGPPCGRGAGPPGGAEPRADRAAFRAARPAVLRLSVFLGLQGAGLGLVLPLLPLWLAARFHAGTGAIAPWIALSQGAGIPFVPFVPALARRLGTARVILLLAGASTLLLAGVPLAPAFLPAALCFVARSALVSMQWPAQLSFLQGAVDPRVRATAAGTALGTWTLANAATPALAGYLLDRGLLDLPLALGVACFAAATGWFWLTLRHTALPEERAGAAGRRGPA